MILEIIKKRSIEFKALKKAPNSISLVELGDITKLDFKTLKTALNDLIKNKEIKYYKGINDIYFYYGEI